MATFSEILSEIILNLKGEIKDLQTIKTHAGELNGGWESINYNLPACFISLDSAERVADDAGRNIINIKLIANIVARTVDSDGYNMENIISILQKIWVTLNNKTWGIHGSSESVVNKMINMSTPDPETYGLAWFAITFSQDIILYPSEFEQEFGLLSTMIINNSNMD